MFKLEPGHYLCLHNGQLEKHRCWDVTESYNASPYDIGEEEAGARGKPIVTGVDGGGKEAVEHGRSGYVADGNDVSRIAQYLLELLSDEGKIREFGERGKQKMLEEFTEEGMIERYLEVIGHRA